MKKVELTKYELGLIKKLLKADLETTRSGDKMLKIFDLQKKLNKAKK